MRIVGRVYVGNTDVNRELAAQGFAWVYRKYSNDTELVKLEAEAKQKRLGLWAEPNPIPPWEWRRGRGRGAGVGWEVVGEVRSISSARLSTSPWNEFSRASGRRPLGILSSTFSKSISSYLPIHPGRLPHISILSSMTAPAALR